MTRAETNRKQNARRALQREKIRSQAKQWYAANSEKAKTKAREFHHRNKTKINEKRRAIRAANPEMAEAQRAWRRAKLDANPHLEREWHLRRLYRMSIQEHFDLWCSQRGCCAICGTDGGRWLLRSKSRPKLVVDHDHETGKVRGLLCVRCNTLLGAIDDKMFLQRATTYVRRSP